MRSLVVVTKRCVTTNPDGGKEAETTVSHYLSTLVPQRAERFARLVRGHWGGCEIRNHWVRDVLFEEDATLAKGQNLNGNLAVLRCTLISLKSRHADHLSWPALSEITAMRPSIPYNMVCNNVFK